MWIHITGVQWTPVMWSHIANDFSAQMFNNVEKDLMVFHHDVATNKTSPSQPPHSTDTHRSLSRQQN